jgi:hypothetical protein
MLRKFTRRLFKGETQAPPARIRTYPERVHELFDPNHDNIEMQQRLNQHSEYNEDVKREREKAGSENRSLYTKQSQSTHGVTPTVYSTLRGLILSKTKEARATRNVTCWNCGKEVKPSRTVEIKTKKAPFFARACGYYYPNDDGTVDIQAPTCKGWNRSDDDWGAPRRDVQTPSGQKFNSQLGN